jgi:hypothetical protein
MPTKAVVHSTRSHGPGWASRAARPVYRDTIGLVTGIEPKVTVEDIRRVALSLPRAYEALVRDRVKFRVGRIVFVALSRDELTMGCGFPREERAALVAAEPEKFFMPIPSEMRYQWIEVRLAAVDHDEMRELVTNAWTMCVPKRVVREHLGCS